MPAETNSPILSCPHHDRLEGKVDLVLRRLGRGDTSFVTLALRMHILERIVYGAVALGLTALAVSLLSLILPTNRLSIQRQERPQSREMSYNKESSLYPFALPPVPEADIR